MLLNLIALVALAVIASVAPGPVDALSVESHNFVRNNNAARHHAVLGRRQSPRTRRCKARSTEASSSAGSSSTTSDSSSSSSTSTESPTSTSTTTTKTSTSKPTTTKTSTSVYHPVPTGGSGGRKACALYVGNVNVPKFISGSNKIGCYMNWSTWKATWGNQLPNIPFFPQYWGPGKESELRKNVVPGFSGYALGMNEPDQSGQSHLSVSEGVRLWRLNLEPLVAQGYRLVAPSCTNSPDGVQWTKDFLAQCTGCRIDAVGTHFYGSDPQDLINHLTNLHNAVNRRIWVTEYACHDFTKGGNCQGEKVYDFMRRSQRFLDDTDWIQYYAWFGLLFNGNLGGVNPINRLINDDSSPTRLGYMYLGLQ